MPVNSGVRPRELRCRNHPERPVVARCPGCRRYFCRECVTEHEGRMLCATCVGAGVTRAEPRTAGRIRWTRWLALGLGLGMSWGVLQFYGIYLARLPDDSHQRVLWKMDPLGEDGSRP